MKFGSLFSGIGGFDLGFERAGMTCSWQAEIDKNCQSLLQKRFGVKIYDDVKKITKGNLSGRPDGDTVPTSSDITSSRGEQRGRGGSDIGDGGRTTEQCAEPVDVICGGFPCQDVSIAGKRKGFAGERSGLWSEFARIIEELKPGWVVIENVPGLLSSNQGRDFETILNQMVEFGYGVSWRVLDAQYFGVAQRRRRVFIVGSLGSGRSAEVLFEREGVRWNPPARREKGQDTTGTVAPSIKSHHFRADAEASAELVTVGALQSRDYKGIGTTIDDKMVCWEMQNATEAYRESGDLAPNLQARMGTGGNNVPLVGVRRLTPTEYEALQGFPRDWTFGSDSTRYKQLGNAVAVPVAEWIGKRIMSLEHP